MTKTHLPCPDAINCGSTDAASLYNDGHWFCFSCNKPFYPKKDVMEETGFTYEYLPCRGVSSEVMRFFSVPTRINGEGKPIAVAYPYGAGKKVRSLETKEFRAVGDMSKATLFGMDKFQAGGRSITIFEGEHDALSGYEILRTPCVSVRSSSSARKDCATNRDFLNSFERVYLAFDNDEVGQKALEAVAWLFDHDKVFHVRLTKHKDCNDYLTKGDGQEFRNAWYSAKRFLPEGIISDRQEFHSIIDKDEGKTGVSYPFPTLNTLTYGIRTGELVLFSALEGIGKTEVLRAIEYHLLKTVSANIGVIHLEEGKARLLKGLAGYELEAPAHLPDGNVSNEEIKHALDSFIEDGRLHIYSHFDTGDLDVILDRIRFLVTVCSCKYIFLDHIGRLVSEMSGDNERQKLDYISSRLERLAKDLDFALIMAAHVNAQGQIRSSTYPSKIAHLWVHLSRNLVAETEEERNFTHLTINKNRFGSKTGPGGILRFNPETFKVTEFIPGDLPT